MTGWYGELEFCYTTIGSQRTGPSKGKGVAVAQKLAKADWEWHQEVLINALFNSLLNSEEVASAALTDVKSKKHIILPHDPGMGQILTVRFLVEQNSARKTLKDPPKLLPSDILANYACHHCATIF
ncbi:hypothetical protein HETIRDRAFT_429259 [Heterobasidion irregulare TC 32-1]|uniref:Uncharacterized protein n=1 Tax=Heterobasidion irregulare (strain TC 32-1) TaxID=747525 RepID=W4JXI9_HETIT|nr:uncharacterized protein HETIRDRAFT_429259 [Heterobasidion irregulare TC 32-1]ETW78189.1 hypothetical protein HETIRDRAFT_429259 [Heterobasidion irregulare TC 32-1]